jgi:hypothetical protein
MKSLAIFIVLVSFYNAQASIEYVESEQNRATPQEIATNRACFEELAKNGCGDPGSDLKQFRSCLHDAFPQLSDGCQKMMTGLYKRKK